MAMPLINDNVCFLFGSFNVNHLGSTAQGPILLIFEFIAKMHYVISRNAVMIFALFIYQTKKTKTKIT